MNRLRGKPAVIVPWIIALIVIAGCFHRGRPQAAPPPSRIPVQQIEAPDRPAAPLASQMSGSPTVTTIDVTEPYIESLIAVDSDVRLVLQRIAEIGKLDLIIPGDIHKTISVRYVHVPVSVALKDVLARSGLRLGAATAAPLPFDTVTVFYRLPANVDSLSVDGIMRRFGVSREIAELLVRSRPPSPE